MELIKELNEFKLYKSGKRKLGLFSCPFCSKYVKRVISKGKKNKSCGCKQHPGTHGLSKNKIYSLWRNMKNRCSSKVKEHHKKAYYDRGIKVCEEWENDFLSFYDWSIENGYKKGLELDREDNDKGYSPGNCRFVTHMVNGQNTRNCKFTKREAKQIIILKNQGIKQKDIAEIYGIARSTVYNLGKNTWLNLE